MTVGLKGVTSPEPALLINDLPGISTELVSGLSNADKSTAGDVWDRVQPPALNKLASIIKNELSKSADFMYEAARTVEPESLSASPVALQAAPNLVGVLLRVPFSPYSELAVLSFACYSLSLTAVTTTLYVYDAVSGVQLTTGSVVVQPGYNELTTVTKAANLTMGGLKWFVGIDASNLILQELGTSETGWSISQSQYSVDCGTIPLASSKTAANFVYSYCYGWAGASIRCSLDKVMAKYADQLQWAYANVCGSLLMAEKLGSSNINLFTNTNRDFTEDREAKFMDEAVMLAKPVCRTIIKELRATPVTQTDPEFQGGYFVGGFV